MADLYENILNSINLVANSKAENLDYDRTSICIILEVTDKGNGKYLVTDSSTKFYAYSYNDKYYAVNDVVYVTIPNNDYNKQKWILGLASSDENEVYKVVDPEGAFSEITFRKVIEEEFGLLANGEEEVITIFETKEQIDSKGKWYLCLSADFNTSIQNAVEGIYGIRLILNTNKEEPKWITYELDPENMTGPIYQQDVTQAVYYIMNEFALDGYKIEFYQNKKFLYENGNSVTYKGLNNENFVNIKVSNIKIYIGEVADIEEQFKDIHYSQIQNNSGFIVGKNQTVTGMFTYDNKKETSVLSSNGTTTFGFKSNGQIKADEYGTNISGPIDFDIKDTLITITFKGNGFMHNMVRIIVAMMIEVSNNRMTVERLQEIMDAKNRLLAPKIAPANGLYLVSVNY